MYYRTMLQSVFDQRKRLNPRYSLRAFAKSLDLDPSHLSKVLAGKLPLSLKAGIKVAETLALGPGENDLFVSSIADQYSSERCDSEDESVLARFQKVAGVAIDSFQIIKDIYHYAVLELTFVEGFVSEPRWIAKVLGLTVIEVESIIARLVKMGLLAWENGSLVKTSRDIATEDQHLSSWALRQHQWQMLEHAQASLGKDPIEVRSMTSMTLAVNPERLPAAKRLIDEFMNRIAGTLEDGRKTRVYGFGVYLYPLQEEQKT